VAEVVEHAQGRGYQAIKCWSEDESRCGLLPIKRHRITAKGVQPICSGAYNGREFLFIWADGSFNGREFYIGVAVFERRMFPVVFSRVFENSSGRRVSFNFDGQCDLSFRKVFCRL